MIINAARDYENQSGMAFLRYLANPVEALCLKEITNRRECNEAKGKPSTSNLLRNHHILYGFSLEATHAIHTEQNYNLLKKNILLNHSIWFKISEGYKKDDIY